MSPRYQAWLAEQSVLEEFRQEEELRLQVERHRQWEVDEQLAQQQWREDQERLAQAREEKARQEVDHVMSCDVILCITVFIFSHCHMFVSKQFRRVPRIVGVTAPNTSQFVSVDLWPKSAIPVQHFSN
jgi:hypothetical protein